MQVVIDRRSDQLGKVFVCSIDYDTHSGQGLGQNKAQTGFEGSQEARALDEEVAISSKPSSVHLVSSLRIDWVDDIEIVLGLLRGVQIYEPNAVRIKTSRSGDPLHDLAHAGKHQLRGGHLEERRRG